MREEILSAFRQRWNGSGTTGTFKFHLVCGDNIKLNKSRTAAYRSCGFSHGLSFSHCPLLPGQIFLIEITEAQDGWSGHLRVGVTQHNPSNFKLVPEMVIPTMTNPDRSATDSDQQSLILRTWATAITKFHNRVPGKQKEIIGQVNRDITQDNIAIFANQRIPVRDLLFCGRKELTFSATGRRFPDFGQSVSVGSRIGILLIPVNDDTGVEMCNLEECCIASDITNYTKCNMHIVINGEDQGPSVHDIPMNKPLYALVDVYSITKRVNIARQMSSLGTLKDLSRDVIYSTVRRNSDCELLPLPKALQHFCQYR